MHENPFVIFDFKEKTSVFSRLAKKKKVSHVFFQRTRCITLVIATQEQVERVKVSANEKIPNIFLVHWQFMKISEITHNWSSDKP